MKYVVTAWCSAWDNEKIVGVYSDRKSAIEQMDKIQQITHICPRIIECEENVQLEDPVTIFSAKMIDKKVVRKDYQTIKSLEEYFPPKIDHIGKDTYIVWADTEEELNQTIESLINKT